MPKYFCNHSSKKLDRNYAGYARAIAWFLDFPIVQQLFLMISKVLRRPKDNLRLQVKILKSGYEFLIPFGRIWQIILSKLQLQSWYYSMLKK